VHNSKMKRISLAVCLSLMPFAAGAAGLGKMTVYSGLGEPLQAEIEISAEKSELSSLSARIAPAETYAEQGVDRPAALSSIRVELVRGATGSPVLKLSTPDPVNEPFLNMLLQLDWPTGRLLREYTTLLDPPGYSLEEQALMPATPAQETPDAAPSAVKKKTSLKPPALAKTPRAAEPASEAMAPEQEYVTRRGDTLRNIARRMQPEDVSLEQMLVGLFHANRSAFDGDNMNQLMVGKVIRAPREDELRAVTQEAALQEVRAHAQNWNAYRSNLAGAVAQSAPTETQVPSQAESGKIATAIEDKAAPAPSGPRDVVKLSQSVTAPAAGAAPESKGAAADGTLRTLEEESIAQDRAIKEVGERIAIFEQQIKDMQQLLLVQNQILADLQKGRPPAAAPAPAPSAPAPAASAETQAKPAPAVPKPPVQAAAEPSLPGDLPLNPLLLGAAGGLLVLLGGVWLYLRGKRKKGLDSFEQGILTSSALKTEAATAATVAATAASNEAAYLSGLAHHTGESLIDTSEVDPISEAEVYMAYGRDAQAEEILKDALAKEPARYELQQKLLEIYANRKDVSAFDTLAGELYAAVGTNSPIWLKAAEFGRALEPSNPMYAPAEAGSKTTEAPEVAEVTEHTPEVEIAEQDDNALDFDLGMLEEEAIATEVADAAEAEAVRAELEMYEPLPTEAEPEEGEAEPIEIEPMEFDTTLELPEPPASGIVQLDADELGMALQDETAAELAETAEEPQEFDMSTLTAETVAADEEMAVEFPTAEYDVVETTPEAISDTAEEMSFDLPELAELEAELAAKPVTEAPVESQLADLMLPIGEAEEGAETSVIAREEPVVPEEPVLATDAMSVSLAETLVTEAPGSAVEEIAIEQPVAEPSGLDFDFDLDIGAEPTVKPEPELTAPALPELDLAAISLDLNAPSPSEATAPNEITLSEAESPDVDTKLDLVTAYMDMGDTEGARELLDEVMREGGPLQRERAQKILDSLS
jgi:pilus assembly protein FimV